MLAKYRSSTRNSKLALLTAVALACLQISAFAFSQAVVSAPPAIPCRVLEAHTSLQLGITVVIFHHRDASERARLGDLLRSHSGESVEIQTTDGQWHSATVMRLKSCFGRGLLLFSPDTAKLAEKDEFVLRFSSKSS